MSPLLAGRTALVTGAASGIGRAIARAAGREGAALVLGDLDESAGVELAAQLARDGIAVHFRRTDVRKRADIDALLDDGARLFGAPDAVFANAGIEGPVSAPWECSESDFMNVIDVNLVGVWRTLCAALPSMIARRSGSFVATASVAGLVGAGGLAAYVASKHGVVGLIRSAAIDAARANVRVNALCPGMIQTAMLERLEAGTPGLRDALLARKPLGRLGTAEEAAEAAIWLASDRAAFVTGHALAVDGGYTAQ